MSQFIVARNHHEDPWGDACYFGKHTKYEPKSKHNDWEAVCDETKKMTLAEAQALIKADIAKKVPHVDYEGVDPEDYDYLIVRVRK